MADSVTSVFKNTVAPLVRDNHVTMGLVLDVFLESVISWTIRYVVGEKMGFWEIFTTVLMATPLIGLGSIGTVKLTDEQGNNITKTSVSVRFLLGLQTVPSIWVSQYIYGTTRNGFYMPKFQIWPILTTVISRTLSRVIIMTLFINKFPGSTYWEKYMDFQHRQIEQGFFAKKPEAQAGGAQGQ